MYYGYIYLKQYDLIIDLYNLDSLNQSVKSDIIGWSFYYNCDRLINHFISKNIKFSKNNIEYLIRNNKIKLLDLVLSHRKNKYLSLYYINISNNDSLKLLIRHKCFLKSDLKYEILQSKTKCVKYMYQNILKFISQ